MTKISEDLAKNCPDFHYNGEIPLDNDTLDYIELPLKGVRIA